MRDMHIRYCGDAGTPPKPAIELDAGGGGLNLENIQLEVCYLAPYIKLQAGGGGMRIRNCAFEAGANLIPDSGQTFIQADDKIDISGCGFARNTATQVVINAPRSELIDSRFDSEVGASAQTTPCVEIGPNAYQCHLSRLRINGPTTSAQQTALWIRGHRTTGSHIELYGAGRLVNDGLNTDLSIIKVVNPVAGAGTYAIELGSGRLSHALVIGGVGGTTAGHGIRTTSGAVYNSEVRGLNGGNGITSAAIASTIIGNRCLDLNGGIPFVYLSGDIFWGNFGDSGTTHLTKIVESIAIPLHALRRMPTAGQVPNIAGIGGVIASDTDPFLRPFDTADQFEQEIVWAVGSTMDVSTTFSLPTTRAAGTDVLVDLFVRTDNAGGGSIDAASFTVFSWADSGVTKADTATDASPSQSVHTITATIAATDVPDGTNRLMLYFRPDAHANDPTILAGIRIRYTRTLTSV